MATLEQIQARIAKLQAQAAAVVAKQSSSVLEKIRDLMNKHGISTADIDAHIGGRRGRKSVAKAVDKRGAVAAKYVDPKTGASWSGRGRAPAWIAGAKDRTKFLVESGKSVAQSEVKVGARPGNYPRGPQPAMYRDPKTGATWSGRGRAPAWLADAKDRTKFLIGEEAATTATGSRGAKAEPAKKAGVKKPAVKRGAAKKAAAKRGAVARKVVRAKTPGAKVEAQVLVVEKAAAKKSTAKKAAARKAPARKARAKKVAAEAVAPVAAVEQSSAASMGSL
ncbi:H-NS family nucleoid-associated regulatory protein [Paraburkholderia flagellata]|uniref:H-NS family nucleoid-associated regulatory protein n=1 Tax=Paraburkholderia flagellata TaxID=2883241 RepID=UPI001F294F5C|nr:H-NS family nucleoid-associated regulatory protein [Paraburkholderia flagellata]